MVGENVWFAGSSDCVPGGGVVVRVDAAPVRASKRKSCVSSCGPMPPTVVAEKEPRSRGRCGRGPRRRVREAARDRGHGGARRGPARSRGRSPASPCSDAASAPGASARVSAAISADAALRLRRGVTGSFPAARRELAIASASGGYPVKSIRPGWTRACALEDGRLGVGAEHRAGATRRSRPRWRGRARSRAAAPSGSRRRRRPRAARRARSRRPRRRGRARTAWTRPICLRSSSGGMRRISVSASSSCW